MQKWLPNSNVMPLKRMSEGQMTEAEHVAVAIRGGASFVHGVRMMNKVKEIANGNGNVLVKMREGFIKLSASLVI